MNRQKKNTSFQQLDSSTKNDGDVLQPYNKGNAI